MTARQPRPGRRGVAKANTAKVQCLRGHPFDRENTLWHIDAAGYLHRQCRSCARDYHRRRRKSRLGRTSQELEP